MGGYIDAKRNKNLLHTSKFSVQLAFISLIFVLCVGAIDCPTNDVQPLVSSCGSECNCEQFYSPVCLDGNETFYNSCFLGCKEFDEETQQYVNCSGAFCGSTFGVVKDGVCESSVCGLLYPFLFVIFIAVFFTFMNNVPAIIILLRTTDEGSGGLSLAYNDVVYKLIGGVPGAQIFALAFDSTCVIFNKDACDDTSNCAFYDNPELRSYFTFVFGGVGKTLSLIMFSLALYYLRTKFKNQGSALYT